jgi:hypothetical protein
MKDVKIDPSELLNSQNKTNNKIINRIRTFLCVKNSYNEQDDLIITIKKMCLEKFCDALGIKCGCNLDNEFMNFFATVTAEAVCNKLFINLRIAPDALRFVRYNGINFITRSIELLNNDDVDEAFIDIFNLIDDNKELIKEIKKFS